jgi:hypothetical protein
MIDERVRQIWIGKGQLTSDPLNDLGKEGGIARRRYEYTLGNGRIGKIEEAASAAQST